MRFHEIPLSGTNRGSPAVINRQQKITFAEMRVHLPKDESKKPPDLRREVFV